MSVSKPPQIRATREIKNMSDRGSRPGEYRGGRQKGTNNKATIEREREISRVVGKTGRPLGKDVIAEAMMKFRDRGALSRRARRVAGRTIIATRRLAITARNAPRHAAATGGVRAFSKVTFAGSNLTCPARQCGLCGVISGACKSPTFPRVRLARPSLCSAICSRGEVRYKQGMPSSGRTACSHRSPGAHLGRAVRARGRRRERRGRFAAARLRSAFVA